jgi:8-oxo-dGTP pyrophosphatase MutT (NUDIX family)
MKVEWNQFELILSRALKIDVPYHHRWPRKVAREAAVLILFSQGEDGAPQLLLTQRTEHVQTHKGQIAFPGGMVDQEDHRAHGLITTALREAQEEVGIASHQVRVVGQLPELSTGTGFQVTPVVSVWVGEEINSIELKLSESEISKIFWVSLNDLLNPVRYRLETFEVPEFPGKQFPTHVYLTDEHRIWGATAAMIKNLLERINEATKCE